VANESSPVTLDALRTILTQAQGVARRLASDPLVGRLLEAFARIPEPDREVIVGILEREAAWCRIVEQTADTAGITVRPNPFASLYVQVVAPEPPRPSDRDVDVVRVGIERFLHLVPYLLDDGVRAQWAASARQLANGSDRTLAAGVARIAREVLAIVRAAHPDLPEDDRDVGPAS